MDQMINIDELDAEELEELEKMIRSTAKLTIRTLEIFYEELEKANLPDALKEAIMVSKANNKN